MHSYIKLAHCQERLERILMSASNAWRDCHVGSNGASFTPVRQMLWAALQNSAISLIQRCYVYTLKSGQAVQQHLDTSEHNSVKRKHKFSGVKCAHA